jgi:hypothetical protein
MPSEFVPIATKPSASGVIGTPGQPPPPSPPSVVASEDAAAASCPLTWPCAEDDEPVAVAADDPGEPVLDAAVLALAPVVDAELEVAPVLSPEPPKAELIDDPVAEGADA